MQCVSIGYTFYAIWRIFTKHFVFQTDYHYKRTSVKVSAVCPGAVDTPMFSSFFRHSIDEEAAIRGRDIWKPIK